MREEWMDEKYDNDGFRICNHLHDIFTYNKDHFRDYPLELRNEIDNNDSLFHAVVSIYYFSPRSFTLEKFREFRKQYPECFKRIVFLSDCFVSAQKHNQDEEKDFRKKMVEYIQDVCR